MNTVIFTVSFYICTKLKMKLKLLFIKKYEFSSTWNLIEIRAFLFKLTNEGLAGGKFDFCETWLFLCRKRLRMKLRVGRQPGDFADKFLFCHKENGKLLVEAKFVWRHIFFRSVNFFFSYLQCVIFCGFRILTRGLFSAATYK